MFSLTTDALDQAKKLIKEALCEALSDPKILGLKPEQAELLNVPGVAELLNCSEEQVRDMCQARKLPCSKPGKSYVFFKSEIIEWVKSHRVQSTIIN